MGQLSYNLLAHATSLKDHYHKLFSFMRIAKFKTRTAKCHSLLPESILAVLNIMVSTEDIVRPVALLFGADDVGKKLLMQRLLG